LVDGATSYELVTYSLEEDVEEARVVLRQSLPGSASSWTPGLDRCLERGIEYAWSVRALGANGTSEWSAASIFQVAAGPSKEEFEQALALVERYLSQSESQAIRGGTFLRPTSRFLDGSQGYVKISGPAAAGLSGPGMVINDQRVLRGREKVEYQPEDPVEIEGGMSMTVRMPLCPGDKIIVSGGVRTGNSRVRITESFPDHSISLSGQDFFWETTIYNPGTQVETLTAFAAYAICVTR
jgi:hypothetical protein